MTQHHYTSTITETAAVAVNAGTCLEDGNSMDNTFDHIGDAVKAVNFCGPLLTHILKGVVLMCVCRAYYLKMQ